MILVLQQEISQLIEELLEMEVMLEMGAQLVLLVESEVLVLLVESEVLPQVHLLVDLWGIVPQLVLSRRVTLNLSPSLELSKQEVMGGMVEMEELE